jgi:putative flippase GtrA
MRIFLVRCIAYCLHRRALAGQFFRFSVVGAITTAFDLSVYVAITRLTAWGEAHLASSAAASFSMAAVLSLFLNNFWTFGRGLDGITRRAPKFFAVAVVGAVWNVVSLLFLTRAGVHDVLAKAIATVFVVLWNFSMQKRWTFK